MASDLVERGRRQRRWAAEFYYKPSGITGAVSDWIERGEDERDEVDDDVHELAAMLFRYERAIPTAESERAADYERLCGAPNESEPAADGEFAGLLRELGEWAQPSMRPACGGRLYRHAAAALRKVLGEKQEAERWKASVTAHVEREAKKCGFEPMKIGDAVNAMSRRLRDERQEREQAEADLARERDQLATARFDLAREREAHEAASDERDELAAQVRALTAEPTGSVGALAKVLSCGSGNGRACNYTKTIHDAAGELARIRQERDAARAEVERLRAELSTLHDELQTFADEEFGPFPTELCIELVRLIRKHTFERRKAEADRLRAQLEPVGRLDAEALADIFDSAFKACAGHAGECTRAGLVAVAQAFARAMLTDGAVDAGNAYVPSLGDDGPAYIRGVIRAALEHAGLHVAAEAARPTYPDPTCPDCKGDGFVHGSTCLGCISKRPGFLEKFGKVAEPVAAEPVADESDAEVMLAAVREKMAPEHVTAFDAARAAAAADAERTRSVLMGALDRAKRLRVDPAKAATLPRASIGLPAPAAELVVEAAISRADVSERRAARMEAVKSQHERPDTTWHSFDEYVAGVRACPWEERCDNIGAAIRMVHKANEPHDRAIHAVTIALEQLALAVDETRRLGGGGR